MYTINKHSQQIQLQNVTLKSSFFTIMTPRLRNKIIYQVLNKTKWALQILKYIKWHQVFPHVAKGKCELLAYYHQQIDQYQQIDNHILQVHGQSLFKSIQSIQFDKLDHLSLHGCHIHNIQPISFLNIPNIQAIFIFDNQFYNIQPILKAKFMSLKMIDLGSRIPSIDQIYRFQINANNMKYLQLIHPQEPKFSNVRPQNLNSWAKIQNFRSRYYDDVNQFTYFDEHNESSHYIYQKKSLGCILRKFMFSLDQYRRRMENPQINDQ